MNLRSILFQKKNLWHVGAIALFLIITSVYLSPNLKGYSIKQADIVNFVGMSREVQDYRINDGEQILWTNAMFSGMPTTQISVLYEGNWFAKSLNKIVGLGLPYPMIYLFIYFISFYILGLSLRIKPYISTLGAIAFGLSSYFLIILEAGHNSKAAAIGFLPLLIAGFILTYRAKKYILATGFAAIGMMLELAANHIQITYYAAFFLVFLGIVELVKAAKSAQIINFLKRTALLLVGYGLAILVNYGNIFGTLDYTKETIRGGSELTVTPDGSNDINEINESGLDKNYVTNWSYGINETFTFFVPNFKGGVSQPIGANEKNRDYIKAAPRQFQQNLSQGAYQYWGDQPFTSGPVYIGIIVMLLAFLALYYVTDKYKWGILTTTLLVITLSWGKNFVSALILIPILLYLMNLFIADEKKRFSFNVVNTALLIFILMTGSAFSNTSLTDLFLQIMPGYNKLRAVTIILAIAELTIPVLGILFLHTLIKNKSEIQNNLKPLLTISGILLLVLVAFYVSPTTFNTFVTNQELGQLDKIQDPQQLAGYEAFFEELSVVRQSIFRADVGRSIGFLIVAIALLVAFLKTNLNKFAFIGVLTIFIFADLYTVDNRYLSTEKRGKNYDQWTESFKQEFPFNEGKAEKEILSRELALNPSIQNKIDSAVAILKTNLKGASNLEKQRKIDFLKHRVLNRNTNFRVLDIGNAFNSSYVGYFNKSIGGYHGAKLSRYQDLIEFHLSKNNQGVINMLNTKYLIETVRNARGEISDSKLVSINENAMGNAWLAKNVKFVENANEEILAMEPNLAYVIASKNTATVLVNNKPIETASITADEVISVIPSGATEAIPVQVPYQALQNEALALILDSTGINWAYDKTPDSLVNKLFSIQIEADKGWNPENTTIADIRYKPYISKEHYPANGQIEMLHYHPDKLTYRFNSNEDELAVFSEIYYDKGWKAYIDSKEVPISRVNYVLRAIEVPAGEHTIEFVFKSNSYEKAGLLANIGNFGIIIILVFGIYFELIKYKKDMSI
jgi:hypothetical protein